MTSRKGEILGGIFIFLLSLTGYLYNLHLLSSQHYFYPKAMSFAAAMIIIGLALIIFPSYRRERFERGENIDELEGLKLLTPKWWGVLVISIVFALANFVYFTVFY